MFRNRYASYNYQQNYIRYPHCNNKETEIQDKEANNYEMDYKMPIDIDTDNEDSNEDFLNYNEELFDFDD
ncbi:1160_t:CDS:2 [Funneliformis mosseae]|uniref:1160_t:CDS:1 n=1 Tax=Funneliformis mosseae TaxID=27381 RepID=A0A9N9HXF4_FUNMO|nr:1160_t:CDS:2 [Funneliformis mosseae]